MMSKPFYLFLLRLIERKKGFEMYIESPKFYPTIICEHFGIKELESNVNYTGKVRKS